MRCAGDHDHQQLMRCTQGRWHTDCSGRLFVDIPAGPDGPLDGPMSITRVQVGEVYSEQDAQAICGLMNRGLAYTELARELESVVLVQLESAADTNVDARKRQRWLTRAQEFIARLLQRIEQQYP
jgi:hypothetical protein